MCRFGFEDPVKLGKIVVSYLLSTLFGFFLNRKVVWEGAVFGKNRNKITQTTPKWSQNYKKQYRLMATKRCPGVPNTTPRRPETNSKVVICDLKTIPWWPHGDLLMSFLSFSDGCQIIFPIFHRFSVDFPLRSCDILESVHGQPKGPRRKPHVFVEGGGVSLQAAWNMESQQILRF